MPGRRGRHEPMIISIRVPGTTVELAKADLITITHALSDGEDWRRRRVDQWCARCENAPQARCEEHLADMALANTYANLAAKLAYILPEPGVRDGGAS